MTRDTSRPESDERVSLLNSILQCPHRDLDKIIEVHRAVQKSDPLFYARLAAWHGEFGEIRDHNEVFTGLLCVDPFIDNRETGLALFRLLPPFMKERVKGLIRGKPVKITTRDKTKKIKIKGGKTIDKPITEKKYVGLKRYLTRSLKVEIANYLKWLESDNDRFDDVVLSNFNPIIGLYASIQMKPSDRAKAILFDRNIPEDSKLIILKQIMEARSPAKKAELIIKNNVPYITAVGLIKKMTPSILTALISQMTPQQVINNIGSLRDRGAYNNPDLKKLVMEKLKKAESAKHVSGLKAKVAKTSSGVEDSEIADQLDKVADESIKRKRTINLPTAVIVDVSASMDIAIEVGKIVASMISGATNDKLYVLTADTMAREIKSKSHTMTSWEDAFRGVNAGGATSVGVGVAFLQRMKYYVEQIVLITDEGENRAPFIGDAITSYKNAMNVDPNVVVIRVDADSRYGNEPSWIRNFRAGLTNAVGDYTQFDISDDDKGYYALPGLIPLLSQKSKLELLYEIQDYPLPVRKPFDEIFRKLRKGRKKKVA